jgi:hypothetical protein
VHAFISWVGCRIVLFSYCCIYASLQAIIIKLPTVMNEFELGVLYFPYLFMSCMMVGLEILHIFWTYYIAESFVSVKISPKMAVHSYD